MGWSIFEVWLTLFPTFYLIMAIREENQNLHEWKLSFPWNSALKNHNLFMWKNYSEKPIKFRKENFIMTTACCSSTSVYSIFSFLLSEQKVNLQNEQLRRNPIIEWQDNTFTQTFPQEFNRNPVVHLTRILDSKSISVLGMCTCVTSSPDVGTFTTSPVNIWFEYGGRR